MLIQRTNKNFLKMCGGKFNSEYLYIKEKHKTMSEDIRKMIDKVKNFKEFINEGVVSKQPIAIKSKKNDLFFIKIYFDNKGRVDKIENKWDVKLPEWYGYDINEIAINDWIRRKEPDLYIEK